MALKSSDDILHRHNATSSIMARRLHPEGIPNWMIMSKAGSPFLRRWIEKYKGEWDLNKDESIWDDHIWKEMAVETPSELAKGGDPNVMILNGHSWFYPLASEPDGDTTLKKLWFGTMYADALTADSINHSIPDNAVTPLALPKLNLQLQKLHITKSYDSLLFMLLVSIMAISLFLARSKKAVREGFWYAQERIERLRRQVFS